MRATLLLVATLLVAGCAAPGADEGDAPGASDPSLVEAPWWPVGSWWDVQIDQAGRASQQVRLVHFWNDSATSHFWLGVDDRRVALDHALHDTNPLLGRIHWALLTPHEKGMHAQGMYTFPVEAGDSFGGLAFGRTWDINVAAGEKPGGLMFNGRSATGDAIAYDYDPDLQWFSFIEVKDEAGAPILVVRVTDHGTGERGPYYFLRGRDYHLGPEGKGTHDETFEVEAEDVPHKSLAIELKGRATGPLRLDFFAPSGEIKHSETLTPGAQLDRVLEIPSPQQGEWTLRYVGTGDFEGAIKAIGILEYTKTL